MKNLLVFTACSLMAYSGMAQHVGIGTTAPETPLHLRQGGAVASLLLLDNSSPSDNYTQIRFRSGGLDMGQLSFQRITQNDYFHIRLANDNKLTVTEGGNVGIGNSTPVHKLHVSGNGFFSGGLSAGVATPTAAIDLGGTLRYRGSSFPNLPQPGAVLTSIDDDGNAQWQRPVAFRVAGLKESFSANATWRKMPFSSTPQYNTSLYYDFIAGEFAPPVTGIYHFDAHAIWEGSATQAEMKIVVLRSGNYITGAYTKNNPFTVFGMENPTTYDQTIKLSSDVRLQPGDKVWVEVRGTGSVGALLLQSADACWFNGHLVTRL